MSDSKRDGSRFVDPDDLSKAERLISDGKDARRRNHGEGNRPKSQFTLTNLLVLIFFVCLGLSAGGDWIPATAFAGILGFLTLVVFALLAIKFPNSSRSRLIWAGITFAYLLSCIAALLRTNA